MWLVMKAKRNYSFIAKGDKGDQEMRHRSCKHNWWCWSGLPWSILRTLPRPCVWVKILQVRSFLLILRTFCTGTCHCGAHADNQHDKEQDTKRYAEIQKPNWSNSTSLTNILLEVKVKTLLRTHKQVFHSLLIGCNLLKNPCKFFSPLQITISHWKWTLLLSGNLNIENSLASAVPVGWS